MNKREQAEEYKGFDISRYGSEKGYRVDLGTKRTKEVESVEEARKLVDFYLSPDKWNSEVDFVEAMKSLEGKTVKEITTNPFGTEMMIVFTDGTQLEIEDYHDTFNLDGQKLIKIQP